MSIKFSQEPAPNLQQLWSVIVADDGSIIYGRPDAEHLIGFGPKDAYSVTFLTKDVIAEPELAIGLCPVFQNGGDMFSVSLAVDECEHWERDAEHVRRLLAREIEMREALHR